MKQWLQRVLSAILVFSARVYVARTKPEVIGITGSVGKTTTKEVISQLLITGRPDLVIRASAGNMNGIEAGFPLAILGFSEVPALLGWLIALPRAVWLGLFGRKVDWLILEYGIDQPGDMRRLTKLIRPSIAVVTRITEAHIEQLQDLDGVYREKLELLEQLRPRGTAIVPADDRRFHEVVVSELLQYGSSGEAALVDQKISPQGSRVIAKIHGQRVNFFTGFLGHGQIESCLAALLVARRLQVSLPAALKMLEQLKPPAGRLRLIEGKKQTMLLDDSYNASLASMSDGLLVLNELATRLKPKRRRIAILGEMRELGTRAEAAHRELGYLIADQVDLAALVGPYREVTREAAIARGMDKSQLLTFETTDDLLAVVETLLAPKAVILIKASQNVMRFERIVKTLMKHPEQASKLLARQSRYWKRKK